MLTPDPLFFFFTLSLSYNKLPEASIRFLPCACAPLRWAKVPPPCCPFHPISLLLRKKRGGAPKKRAFGGERKLITTVTPAQSTNRAKRHNKSRSPPAKATAQITTKPLPKSGEDEYRPPRQERSREWWSRRGKKALFFGGSTPFLWANTKEMGSNRRTGQRPPPNVSAHTQKVQ